MNKRESDYVTKYAHSTDPLVRGKVAASGPNNFTKLWSDSEPAALNAALEKSGVSIKATDSMPSQDTKDNQACVKFFPESDRGSWHTLPGGQSTFIDRNGLPIENRAVFRGRLNPRQPPNDYCRGLVGNWGNADRPDLRPMDGGHMIPSAAGGFNGRANLAPQASVMNQRLWTKVENAMKQCVNAGAYVSYTVNVSFIGNDAGGIPSLVPSGWMASVTIWNVFGFGVGSYEWVFPTSARSFASIDVLNQADMFWDPNVDAKVREFVGFLSPVRCF